MNDGVLLGIEHRLRRRNRRAAAPAAALEHKATSWSRPTRSCSRPIEELETTNEELQSTNEELETTNEELQSSNEELETMNEELQSSNEELETMNEELRHRTLEVSDTNSFLEIVLGTIGLAVGVLDRHQRIQIWNSLSRDMWGLSADEVEDRHLLSLDIGLPVAQLKEPLRACLAGDSQREELVLDATNRRGRAFRCRVTCMPLGDARDQDVSGVILMMEPADADDLPETAPVPLHAGS